MADVEEVVEGEVYGDPGLDVVYMLTTEDNPFSPFDQFHQWWIWDELHGHHSCGLLARYINDSTELPQWMQDEARHAAIDEVIADAIHARFKKVSREDYKIEEVKETNVDQVETES